MNRNKTAQNNWDSNIVNSSKNHCRGGFERPDLEGITRTTHGITLVTLVITIIIMLILAGVIIATTMDSDGILADAENATQKWNDRITAQDQAIQNALAKRNEILGGTTTPTIPVEPEDQLPAGWDSSKVAAVVEEGTRKAPIPVGYTASKVSTEDEISEGLVIYQGTDPVIGEQNSTAHTTAMTTRNQFVWIPVDDINQMVMCKSNASGSVCELELIGGILQCTNIAHTSTKTDLCGRLYEIGSRSGDTTNMNFADRTQTWNARGYREPDIVSDYDDYEKYMVLAGIESGDVVDFQSQLNSDFVAMVNSVYKYGGFYVARYEAGINGASLKNQKVILAGANAGVNQTISQGVERWYGLYDAVRRQISVGTGTIQSHMIYGCQYDQIINFLENNSNNEPQRLHAELPLTVGLAGANSADVMNNIYDLESNWQEWTAEARDTEYRVPRGSVAAGVRCPASRRRYLSPDNLDYSCTTRAAVYL